jgi:glycosyltransferase involved in cell wall biosynthesis
MLGNDEQFLISVIIPTYNRSDLILRAINSVIAQSYSHLEIIIVDDASQEDIARLVKQIDDCRIKYFRHPDNLGGSESRNTGIKHAQGQLIAFLDSDDVWMPNKLQRQLDEVAKALPQNDLHSLICYSKFQLSPKSFYAQSIFPNRGKQPQETVANYLWVSRGEMLTSTLLLSRELALKTLFKPGLIKHQDLDFVIRLEQNGATFLFVPQVLTIWHNEPRKDRTSKNSDYQFSLNWINTYQGYITDQEIRGFIVKEVASKMLLDEQKKSQAIKILIEGFFEQLIPLNLVLFLLIKQAVPRKYQLALKALLQKVKLIGKT